MRINIRVRPGARADAVGGRWESPRGSALVVAVRARAVEGRANVAVVESVAAAFGLSRGAVTLVSGPHSRDKVLELLGDDVALDARLRQLQQS